MNQKTLFIISSVIRAIQTTWAVGTSRHLHQRVEEHKRSTIGDHVKEEREKDPNREHDKQFRNPKKCQSKLLDL